MCEGFWTTSQLTPAQIAALHKTQSDDFRTRFSGKRRLRGSLLVVPDDDEGVAAMASLELGLVDVVARAVLPRDDAERKFIAALGRLTTRDRNILLRAPICVKINQCFGCTKSFLGDDVAVLARSSGEEPASPRHRAGVESMAWRTTR